VAVVAGVDHVRVERVRFSAPTVDHDPALVDQPLPEPPCVCVHPSSVELLHASPERYLDSVFTR
jgi:hypothetical protein